MEETSVCGPNATCSKETQYSGQTETTPSIGMTKRSPKNCFRYVFICLFSPQHVAPVQERRVVSVQEKVARKMAKLRAKLGVTDADLAPASVALESEGLSGGVQDGDGVEVGAGVGVGTDTEDRSSTGRDRRKAPVDIGVWKKETEEMMSLLGTTAESAHDYPMTELKRTVRVRVTYRSTSIHSTRNEYGVRESDIPVSHMAEHSTPPSGLISQPISPVTRAIRVSHTAC